MSRTPGRPRCSVTGVEIDLEQAFVLDVRAAQRRLSELKEAAAALDRVLRLAGAPRPVTTADEVPERFIVAPSVAAGFDAGVCRSLFVPFAKYREEKARSYLARMRANPVYGPRLAAVPSDEMGRVLKLGNQLTSRVGRGKRLGTDIVDAIRWGVAVVLRELRVEEAFSSLRTHALEKRLAELGVPEDVHERLTASLDRKAS